MPHQIWSSLRKTNRCRDRVFDATTGIKWARRLRESGQWDAAGNAYERLLPLAERCWGPAHRDTLQLKRDGAACLCERGHFDAAAGILHEILALPCCAGGAQRLETVAALGRVVALDGRLIAAERMLRRCFQQARRHLGLHHPSTLVVIDALAWVLLDLGAYQRAAVLQRAAWTIRRRNLGLRHPDTTSTLEKIAVLCATGGDFLQAARLLRRACTLRRVEDGPPHWQTRSLLGGVLWRQGRQRDAQRHFAAAYAWQRLHLGKMHSHTLSTQGGLALLLASVGQDTAAERLHRRRLAAHLERGGTPAEVLTAMQRLAAFLLHRERNDEAEPLLLGAWARAQRTLSPYHPTASTTRVWLGICLQRLGRRAHAEFHLQAAFKGLSGTLSPSHADVIWARDALVALYETWNEHATAQRCLAVHRKNVLRAQLALVC